MKKFIERQGWFALVIAVVVVVAAVVAVVVIVGGGSDGGDDEVTDNPFDDQVSMPVDDGTPCGQVHAGHNVMMWDSTMADQMVEADCGWPYEPFMVSTDGGEEDPAFDAAPFEPRMYADLWNFLSDEVGATCTIGSIFEEVEGLVFGFRYELATDACTEMGEGDVVVSAREYSARGLRDAAAHEAEGDAVLVLGRWTITIDAADDLVESTAAGLVDMGAVRVDGAG